MTDILPTPTTPAPKLPSIRSGDPKEIAAAAFSRRGKYVETFPNYLQSLADEQSSIYKKKRPRQETLNQQLDILDAMFTYLAIHADWKSESHLAYSAALRSQKQFCATLKDLKNLKLPKAPLASVTPPPVVHR